MVVLYHLLYGLEFERALGFGDGQGSLACCRPCGCKELDTTERNEMNLLDRSVTQCRVCETLNPPTFLPEQTEKGSPHDSTQIRTLNLVARNDLKYHLLESPEETIFTDERTFVPCGLRRTRYTVVTDQKILEANLLPPGASAQLPEQSVPGL